MEQIECADVSLEVEWVLAEPSRLRVAPEFRVGMAELSN